MKIALFPNYEKNRTEELLKKVISILENNGAEYVIHNGADANDYSKVDLAITVGGDGTLIKHAKAAAVSSVPCIGINTGRLGFLTNLVAENIDMLEGIFGGKYKSESRMMLSVTAEKDGNIVYSGIALNEAVVSSGSVARLIDVDLTVDNDVIDYRADGVIISTPTGSTAYSMSAGGPIIDPAVRCLTVTPICSHSLTARPMLAKEDAEIVLRLSKTSRTSAYLTVDGQKCVEVDFDTLVTVKKSPFDAKLINVSNNTIYKTLSHKF